MNEKRCSISTSNKSFVGEVISNTFAVFKWAVEPTAPSIPSFSQRTALKDWR